MGLGKWLCLSRDLEPEVQGPLEVLQFQPFCDFVSLVLEQLKKKNLVGVCTGLNTTFFAWTEINTSAPLFLPHNFLD